MSNMRLFGLGALMAAAVACGGEKQKPEEHPKAGAPDVVQLDSAQFAAAEVELGAVGRLPADSISLTGTIGFDPARISHIGPRTQGRIRRVLVDIGSRVQRGATLAVLDSPELGAAQATGAKARVGRNVAARNFERGERLFRDGIISERRHLELEAELRDREAELAAAFQALTALGAEPDSNASGVFTLRAPLTGEIVEKHATAGEVVGPDSDLFVVGDLSRVWLVLDLYEADVGQVRAGTSAHVVVDAYPDRGFEARVVQVAALVDSVSRTVKVRIDIPNTERLLKPGMFARASLAIPTSDSAVGVPQEAVQSLEGRDVVFVPESPTRFRPQTVKPGPVRAGGWVEIVDGLALGDTVVTKGGFVLKAHLLREEFGEGGH